MSKYASTAYMFNIQNGGIKAIYEMENGISKFKSIDSNEVWRVSGKQVIKTETDDGQVKITVYADENSDGIFTKLSESNNDPDTQHKGGQDPDFQENHDVEQNLNTNSALVSFENNGREKYAFTVESGMVTHVRELKHGAMQEQSPSFYEQYTVDSNNDILKIESKRNGQEISRYRDVDHDGLFAKVAEDFVAATTPTASSAPSIANILFYGSDNDDAIGLTADGSAIGGLGADRFIFRELNHVKIEDFNHSHGDKIVIDTGLGFKSLEHVAKYVTDVNYDGDNTTIEFGDSISITLVGSAPSTVSTSDFLVLS